MTATTVHHGGREIAGAEQPVALGRLVRWGAAIASLAAASVHASAIAGHTFHWLHAGAFMAMTVFQAWWAYLVLRSASARVLVIGVAGQGAIVALWFVSRTAGIPGFLPGSHDPEPVGLKDGVAVALAIAVLVAIDLMSRRDLRARQVRPSVSGAAATAFVVAVALVAVPAVLSGGHDHAASTGHTHSHGGSP